MGPILESTPAWLWGALALVAAVAAGVVLRHPRVKGWWGEQQVRAMLRTGLNPHLYVDLHNVTLPLPDGGSTQIDHLLFSPYGVFVLETKRMKGWIYGSAHQPEWTQKIHPRHSQKFQNPLRQNYLHTQTVRALLQLPAEHVHSVVVFMGDSQFKTDLPPHVTQGKGCIDYILRFQQEAWGPEVMQALIDRVERLRLNPSRATQKAHIAHVQQRKAAQAPAEKKAAAGARSARTAEAPAAPRAKGGKSADGAKGAEGVLRSVPSVPPGTAPAAADAPVSVAAVPPTAQRAAHSATTCPQCQSALRRMRLQRGPLAGEVVYRCSNTALCHYVQPLPDSAAA